MMKKAIPCTACSANTEVKRVKVNLMVDKETNHIVTVSSRIQSCASCGHKEYTDKEASRLRELTAFYQKEARIEKEDEENSVEEVTTTEGKDKIEDDKEVA